MVPRKTELEEFEEEVSTWHKRANEAAERSVKLQASNNRLITTLKKIQQMGHVGDAWVDAATVALRAK